MEYAPLLLVTRHADGTAESGLVNGSPFTAEHLAEDTALMADDRCAKCPQGHKHAVTAAAPVTPAEQRTAREMQREMLAGLAQQQRGYAEAILRNALAAVSAGLSWPEVGEALGVPHEDVRRQVEAGSPVAVVRATHDPARVRHGDG